MVGAHLEGMPLHADLTSRGAVLVERTTTEAAYALHALPGTTPPKPGLRRVAVGGTEIAVEVYRLPETEVGGLLSTIASPLGIGRVTLADGREVPGFICEPWAFEGAEDISDHGGWRAYLAAGPPVAQKP